MILRIEMPKDNAAFRSGVVDRWHKSEGDSVEFGDDLCDITVDEFMALQRTKRASLLGSTRKRQNRKVSDGYDRRQGRGAATVRLTVSEGGLKLQQILVPVGGRAEVGEVLGLLAKAGDPGEGVEAGAARLAVNIVEGSSDSGWTEP